MNVVDPERSCSEQSVLSGEPIFGSAVAEVEHWLLIEYRGRWARDWTECDFPPGVRQWLENVNTTHRRLRIQLIKRTAGEGDLHVFVVTTGAKACIHRLSIPSLAELPTIDVAAALADPTSSADAPKALYLVCTHGRRDRCCALRGVALHRTLSEQALDGELWQSSHQGGHRFAATLLYLPLGVHYGRLDPEDAEPLAAAHRQGRLYDLRCYRGQTRLSPPVQTAEAWLREQEMELGFAGVEHVEHAMHADGHWMATFRSDNKLHRLTVVQRQGTHGRKKSCAAEAASLPTFFYVVRHAAQTLA